MTDTTIVPDLEQPKPKPTLSRCPHSDGNSCEQYRLQGLRCQDCPVPDLPPEPKLTGRKRRGGLFVTDAELIEKLNVPEKIARQALQALDAQRVGFPAKQKLWGDRRYWPAVRAYFDRTLGANITSPPLRREGGNVHRI